MKLSYHSPTTQCNQLKTLAAETQEELTEEQRPSYADNFALGGNGRLQSVLSIIKTPSPEIFGHYPPTEPESLGQKKTGLQR